MSYLRALACLCILQFLCLAVPSSAADYTIYVAPKGSAAFEFAKTKTNGKSVLAERSLQKALSSAASLLSEDNVVRVLIADGDYASRFGGGTWKLPAVIAPKARLLLLGGWNDDYTDREPFARLSRLVTHRGRGGAILEIGRNSQLSELVVSGLVFDARPSNAYDSEFNLKKTGTRTYRLLSFAQLKVDRLVVADNIFANAPQVAFEPYVSPLSEASQADITNNFFINNVIPIQELSGVPVGKTLSRINLRHNSFVLNWPYNPDPTSSNVGAVGLYHKGGVENVVIEGNVFAFNVGGAFQHDWPLERMPAISFRHNLFFENASLFESNGAGDGAIVGKFGTNPVYMLVDLETLEDELPYKLEQNVSEDPEIGLASFLHVDVDEDDPYADHLISGYAPPVEVVPGSLPFARGRAEGYGVGAERVWRE